MGTRTPEGYRHEALLYSGIGEFLTGTIAFIRRAVDAGDPILVVVSAAKIGLLQRELGADADAVRFADMAEVGDNPARIIAAWQAFLHEHAGASRVWGIGEPIHPERSPTELAECQLHESLLNLAFDEATPFWLLCPYDLEALAAEVIDEAHRTHPFVARGQERQPCEHYLPIDRTEPFNRPFEPAPVSVVPHRFDADGLVELRSQVAQHAALAGLGPDAVSRFVLAVNELAANSLRHGGGAGELRLWIEAGAVVGEVTDRGYITSPLVGRVAPPTGTTNGRGLWLANQLCDLLQIHSSRDGTTIRVHHRLS